MIKKILLPIIITISAISFNACDSSSSSESEDTYDSIPTSFVINWKEQPQSCTALFDKDTVFFDLTLKHWSWSEVFVFNENRYRNTQTFKGLEKTDLDFMCYYMKTLAKATTDSSKYVKLNNIDCIGENIIVDYIMDATYADSFTPAISASNMYNLCKIIQEEEMTVGDIFFGTTQENSATRLKQSPFAIF